MYELTITSPVLWGQTEILNKFKVGKNSFTTPFAKLPRPEPVPPARELIKIIESK